MTKLKRLLTVPLHYWKHRKLEFDLYWRISEADNNKKELVLTIWHYRWMDRFYEWGTNNWHHITLWQSR